MRKQIARIAASSLLVAAIAALPWCASAQDSAAKAPAASDQTAPAKAKKGTSFFGELTAVDTNAMTLTVSNLTLHVTADTVIKKGSQPAKLSDGVVGQPTRGTYQKSADGKLEALTVHLNSKAGSKGGTKSGEKTGGKKKKASADAGGN